MVFAHGFGCDQNMWRFVAPEFEDRFKVVLFDHVGAGGSDLSAYDTRKYSTLSGYAEDMVEIGRVLSPKGRGLRRSFRQRDDRRSSFCQGARNIWATGPGRSFSALHR